MTVPASADEGAALRPGPEPASEPGSTPDPVAPPRTRLSARDAVAGTCPYLVSSGGAWRSTTASRDHRCSAVDPAASQTSDKQRRHCLTANHVDCSTFRAARSARANNLIAGASAAAVEGADRTRRPLARTAPILLEPTRLVDQTLRIGLDRGPGQIALIALMVVAFAVVALARLSAGAPPVTPTPGPSSVAVLPSSTPKPRPTPTVTPSVEPSASPAPPFRATYKVKKGDTLKQIAARYKVTVASIQKANGMKNTTLKVGQVLKIP